MKAHLLALDPTKTYATRANAVKAVEKVFGPNHPHPGSADCRYTIATTEAGRYFPLFIGTSAVEAGAHHHFPTAN